MLKKQLLWLLLMPFYLWGITITEDTTLDKDMVYNENVIVNGAILALNNHTLTVNGDLNITGYNARLQMTKTEDKLIVKGDLIFAGASTYNDLTKGVIELAGNFYQKGTRTTIRSNLDCSYGYYSTLDYTGCNIRYNNNNAYSFYSRDEHRVILNGKTKQVVNFEGGSYSRFNHLEIQNNSTEGVEFKQLNVVGEWNRNGNFVTITDIRNLKLTEDYTILNDVKMQSNSLDLNGYNLTIQGDLIVNSANLYINRGTLTVNKSLSFNGYGGRLHMTNLNDNVVVKENLTFAGASTYQDLTNGVIKLAGNFYQKGTRTTIRSNLDCSYGYYSTLDYTGCNIRYNNDNAYSFYATDKHKVILNGIEKQIVDFEGGSYSRFNHLEIQNSSKEGVVFEELNIVGEWIRNENFVTITDIRNLKLTEDYTIPNSVKMQSNNIDLNGYSLTIEGDLTVNSVNFYINKGTLIVNKNLSFNGYGCRLHMTNSNDKVIVKENLTFNGASTYQDLTNGVIELAGDFYQKGTRTTIRSNLDCSYGYYSTLDYTGCNIRYNNNNAYSFYSTFKHKVLLNGKRQQVIAFEAPDSSAFANLEIINPIVDIDVSSGKNIKVKGDLYVDNHLYIDTYKDNELITFTRYRDIHKTYMSLSRGLQLIALPTQQNLTQTQIASIFSDANISYLLKYDSDSKKWQGFGNNKIAKDKIVNHKVKTLRTIKAGEGFFVKTLGEVELQFPRADDYGVDDIGIGSLGSGWHLVGSNKIVHNDSLLEKHNDIKVIRYVKERKDYYWSEDEGVQEEYRRRGIEKFEENNATNSGFWVYVE